MNPPAGPHLRASSRGSPAFPEAPGLHGDGGRARRKRRRRCGRAACPLPPPAGRAGPWSRDGPGASCSSCCCRRWERPRRENSTRTACWGSAGAPARPISRRPTSGSPGNGTCCPSTPPPGPGSGSRRRFGDSGRPRGRGGVRRLAWLCAPASSQAGSQPETRRCSVPAIRAVKPSGVWLRGEKFAQSLLTRGKSSPRIRLQGEKFSQNLAEVGKFSQSLPMGVKFFWDLATEGKVLLECGCRGKILPESGYRKKVLPESGYKGKKFSQTLAVGGKVLLESGYGGKKFS